MSFQFVSPPEAVDDVILSTLSTDLTKAQKQLNYSANLLRGLVWDPTHDSRVDNLVRQTASMALEYRDDILPKSKKLVANLQCFFEVYACLDFLEFKEVLPDLIKMTVEYAEQAKDVEDLHKRLGGALGALEKMATRTGSLLDKEIEIYHQEQVAIMKKLQKIHTKRDVAMACITGAAAIFDAARGKELGRAVALAANAGVYKGFQNKSRNCEAMGDMMEASLKIATNAVKKLTEELFLCISQFRYAMANIAGFFTVIHHELCVYGKKLGMLHKNPVEIHFRLVNRKAAEIIAGCRRFVVMSSQVEIELRAIELTPGVKPDRSLLLPPRSVSIQETLGGENGNR